ncbi:MAG: multi-sensor hybrid histidine kinase [Armatimonadetes bacterium]|nr:multi-sensor hybrid histidine kinase [Armatimonadota bacterium]
MRLWEERVRAARASTPDAAAPTLTELLPAVLQDVVEALQRVGRLPRRTTPGAADERAGGSQAFAAGATLEHVLEEYGLLRTTLFSFLEAEEPLPPAERDAVYQVLEVATQRASRWFSTAHQETLHGREALHRLLVENARDYAMLTADRDNRVTSWNTGAERLMGYREEEILGQSASIIFVPEDRAKGDDLKELAKALDTGEAVNERWHLRKDGSRFWGSGIMHALYDPAGQFVGFGKVMRDRTAEMLVEQERSHYLERLRMLADITSDLLFQNQPSRFIEHVYARLARSLDLEVYVNYLVNDSGNALRLAAYAGLPEHVAEEIRHLSFGMAVCGAVAQQRERVVAENIQQSTDPRTALVRSVGVRAYTCHPLIAGEELIGTLSFGTTRRDTFAPDELELIRSVCEQVAVALERARLMQTLQDRAAALTDADQRKDEFLAMLAHELRNPLAGIVNAVHVLNAIDEQVSPRQRLRDIVGRQASNLTRMVDDLLDVSRITQRKIELRRETIDVVAVAHQAAEAIRPLVESRGHELTFEPPREALCVEADRTRLEQVVSNLLNNAAKYTPPGGRICCSPRLTAPPSGPRVGLASASRWSAGSWSYMAERLKPAAPDPARAVRSRCGYPSRPVMPPLRSSPSPFQGRCRRATASWWLKTMWMRRRRWRNCSNSGITRCRWLTPARPDSTRYAPSSRTSCCWI